MATGRGWNELGRRGTVMQVRGDWSWLKQTFNFPSWSNMQICWRCKASSDEFDWRDLSANARWRSQRLTGEAVLQASARAKHPFEPHSQLGPEGQVRVGALAETLLRDEDGTETARPHTGHGATRRQGAMRTPHPRPNATGELTQLSASSPSKVNTNLCVA